MAADRDTGGTSMATIADAVTAKGNDADPAPMVLISADSHVIEPPDILKERVPPAFREAAPRFPQLKVGEGFQSHPGGSHPGERLKEMQTDGVSAEVLYPTHLLSHFGMDDGKLQAACFRAYNDWLIEYVRVAPHRLVGIAAISVYDIEGAVAELERCAKAGMKGSIIWQVPHRDLPFHSSHYDRFWAASQDLGMPVSLHILTGHGYTKDKAFFETRGIENYRASVNLKLAEISDALFTLIFYGVLERYPRLQFLSVENEAGWLPFMLQQWDYYYRRFRKVNPLPIQHEPSEYFRRQVYATFFRDGVGGHNFEWWGEDNCLWSNDYPHQNSTWPESSKHIEKNLGHLPAGILRKLLCDNAAKLFALDVARLTAPN
jgi:predicted TIM-barrel fold metal-dependent hydrolase